MTAARMVTACRTRGSSGPTPMRSASATLSTCLPSADAFFRRSSDAVRMCASACKRSRVMTPAPSAMSEITAVLAARSASGGLVCGGIRASSVATATTMSSTIDRMIASMAERPAVNPNVDDIADRAKHWYAKATQVLAATQYRLAELAGTGRLDPDESMSLQENLFYIWE